MMHRLTFSLLCATCTLSAAAYAADVAAPVVSEAVVPPVASFFSKPLVLRGTLGDGQVQLSIRPKAVADEGLEGSYFVFGRSANILLAGEMEDDTLFLEESENGTDISGQWQGKLQGDILSGTWTSADGETTRPFSLRIMPAETKTALSRKAPVLSTK
jgi:hypothetical protein